MWQFPFQIPWPINSAQQTITTAKPPNPTTAEPINPTTIADPTDPTDPCINLNVWIGDGECDDATNNAECGYDGGDCCGDDVKTTYCEVCECLQ